jgi:hypothetical protein
VPQRAQALLFRFGQLVQRAPAFAHLLALARRHLAVIAAAFAQPLLLLGRQALPALPAVQDARAPVRRHLVPVLLQPGEVGLLPGRQLVPGRRIHRAWRQPVVGLRAGRSQQQQQKEKQRPHHRRCPGLSAATGASASQA